MHEPQKDASVGVRPVWTACRALCWLDLTAWSSQPEYRPACFRESPCPGLTCTHTQTLKLKSSQSNKTQGTKKVFSMAKLTQPHPPRVPGRSPSPWGFWWSSGKWRWAGQWGALTGSTPVASGSTTWWTERNLEGQTHTPRFPQKQNTLFHWTYHGFFTMRSSSLRNPFWTIHLSLRNLDLEEKIKSNCADQITLIGHMGGLNGGSKFF